MKLDRDNSVPIYIQIQELLEEMLQNGTLKPNDLVPSENEMAEKLKVSRLTVRKSYGEMVKRGLFFTIQGKGTYVKGMQPSAPVKEEQDKSQKVIGVILPEVHGFYGDIFQGIQKQCTQEGKSVLLMFNNEVQNEITAIQQMLAGKVEGIIISPSRHANTVVEHYQKLVNSQIPTVMVGKPPFKISAPAVFCDDTLGVYRAVEYLIAHENTHIAYITDTTYEDEASQERYAGYLAAMNDYLPNEKPMVLDMQSPEFQQQILEKTSGKEPVTAFFCYCDIAAASVYAILKNAGRRVPEDVEIIGYDNIADSRNYGMDKQLTSVDQRRELLGMQSVALLETLMREPPIRHTHMEIVIHPKLVLKQTTRAEE